MRAPFRVLEEADGRCLMSDGSRLTFTCRRHASLAPLPLGRDGGEGQEQLLGVSCLVLGEKR